MRVRGHHRGVLRLRDEKCDGVWMAAPRSALPAPRSLPAGCFTNRFGGTGLGFHVVFLHCSAWSAEIRFIRGVVWRGASRADGPAHFCLAVFFQHAALYLALCRSAALASSQADERLAESNGLV